MVSNFDISILISLFSLGLFGGFGHCGFMCGPFVVMQVNNRLQNIKIANFSYLQKLQGLALLPYHCGRITTYSFLGFICSFLGENIRVSSNFNIVSGTLLLIASILVFNLILKNARIKIPLKIPKITLKIAFLAQLKENLKNIINPLFQNPKGFDGYILGIILGFIPCGLLYSALIITITIENPLFAAIGMLIFGICTIPPLFLSALGGYLFFSKLQFGLKLITQFILLINMIMLIIMALSQFRII